MRRTKRKYGILIAFYLLCCLQGYSQVQGDISKLKEIAAAIKETRVYGYHYEMKVTYPDGQMDKLVGKNYIDGDNKVMFNENQDYIILLTPHWYYKADHLQKSVTLVNLQQHDNDANKVTYRGNIFSGSTTAYFLDSVVMKYGILKDYRESGDTVLLAFEFKINSPIRKMEVSYNSRTHLPIRIITEAFYPDEPFDIVGSDGGTLQTIITEDYQKTIRMQPGDVEKYFNVKSGKVRLHQFKNYKIYSLL